MIHLCAFEYCRTCAFCQPAATCPSNALAKLFASPFGLGNCSLFCISSFIFGTDIGSNISAGCLDLNSTLILFVFGSIVALDVFVATFDVVFTNITITCDNFTLAFNRLDVVIAFDVVFTNFIINCSDFTLAINSIFRSFSSFSIFSIFSIFIVGFSVSIFSVGFSVGFSVNVSAILPPDSDVDVEESKK